MMAHCQSARPSTGQGGFPPAAAAKFLGVRVRTLDAAGLTFAAREDVERWLVSASADALSGLVLLDRAPRRREMA